MKVPPRLRLLSQNNPEKQIWLRPETRFCFPATSLNATRRLPLCPRASTGQQNSLPPETRLCFPATLLNATRHLPLCPRASTGQQNKSRPETRLCQTAASLNTTTSLRPILAPKPPSQDGETLSGFQLRRESTFPNDRFLMPFRRKDKLVFRNPCPSTLPLSL